MENNIIILCDGIIIFTWLLFMRNHLTVNSKIILNILMAILAVISFIKNSYSGIIILIMILTGVSCFTSYMLIHMYFHDMQKAKLKDFPKEVWLDIAFLIDTIWASLILL